jgi:hypothetical protein
MHIIGERGSLVRVIIIFKVWMHLKVFLKLKNPKNSLFWVKKTKETKTQKKTKNPKKPTGLGWFFPLPPPPPTVRTNLSLWLASTGGKRYTIMSKRHT